MSDIRQRKSYEFEDSYSIRESGGDPTGNADFLRQQFLRKQRDLNTTINVKRTSGPIDKSDDPNAESLSEGQFGKANSSSREQEPTDTFTNLVEALNGNFIPETSTVQTASEKLTKQDLHQWLETTHQPWAQIVFQREIEQAKKLVNEYAKSEAGDKIPEVNWLYNQIKREMRALKALSVLNQSSDETLSTQNYEWLINQERQNQWHKWCEFSTRNHQIEKQIEHEQREMPNKIKELEESGYLTFEHLEPDLQEQLQAYPDKKYRILTEHLERKLQGNRIKIREEFQTNIKKLEAEGHLTFGHLDPKLQEQLRAWPNFETYTKYNIFTEKAKSLSDEDKRTFKKGLEEWTSTEQHKQLVKKHEKLLKIIRSLQELHPVQQLKEADYLQDFDSLETKLQFDKRSEAIQQFHTIQAWLDKSPENIDDLLPPSLDRYHQRCKTLLKDYEDLYEELMRQLDLQNHEPKSPTNMAPTGPLNQTNKKLDDVTEEFTKSVKHLTVRRKVIEKCINLLDSKFSASQDRFQRIIEKSNEFNNFTEELKQAAITDYDHTSNQFKQLIEKVKTTSGAQRNAYYKSASEILCELKVQEQNTVRKINEHWYKKVLPIYQIADKNVNFIRENSKYMFCPKGDDFNLVRLSLTPVALEAFQAFDDQQALDNLQALASTIDTMAKEIQDWRDQFSSIQKKIHTARHDINLYKEYLSESKQEDYNALLPDLKKTVERGKKSLGDGPDFEALKTVVAKLEQIAEMSRNVYTFHSIQWQRKLLRP